MRLLNMKLENWRGVTRREIEFASGVTVIEGPNEIGKSTIVEALQVLFADLDSSKSQRIKTIQPIGQDVGSSVELTFAVDEHHLVYGKTYNKKPATTLSVSGAQTLQRSGREAHEWVAEFLADQVDMDLWRALLVDQSDTLGKTKLQNSQGLAKALDEAAGNAGASGQLEDTDLYSAIEAEYEQYFTLKTDRPKAAVIDLEKRVAKSQEALTQAQAALQTIASDTKDHERRAAEVLRLQGQLPALQEQARIQELAWTELGSLQQQQQAKQQDLSAAQKLLHDLQQTLDTRLTLAEDIRSSVAHVASEQELGAPMQAQAQRLKSQMGAAREALQQLRRELEQARTGASLASADAQHYANQKVLQDLETNLSQLQTLEAQMSDHLQVTKSTDINDAVVEQLRAAETALAVVEGRRDTAATTFELLAHSNLSAKIGGEEVSIEAGEQTNGVVAQALVIDLLGTAQITLTPSASVAQIQDSLKEAQSQLDQLCRTYDVSGAGQAQQINAQRRQAQTQLDKLASAQQQLLRDKSLDEIKHEVASLNAVATHYLEQRSPDFELPATGTDAQATLEQAQQNLQRLEAGLEQQRQVEEEQRAQFEEVDAGYREVQQNLQGLMATLAEKQSRIAQDREVKPDEVLEAEAVEHRAIVTKLDGEAAALAAAWQAANPESVLELRDNARLVCTRATEDLAASQRGLDILNDRLQQAQADGRFDTAEAAANRHAQLLREQQALQKRAAAAKRLWGSIKEQRSRSRQAYVEPLKRATERLGAIVFGSSFAVELDENWTLVSRTLDGKTLLFAELSVGAREQLGILLRLAAGQVTAQQGGVPLIIDDALGFSDPTRLSTMGAAIAAAGRQAQVIILTCTPGRFTHVGNAKAVTLE